MTKDKIQMCLKGVGRDYVMGTNVVRALHDININVLVGEFITIVGSSGSGKSTLMHLIGCLDTPTAGTYVLGGENVSTMPDVQLSKLRNRKVGFVFQQFNLLPNLTVLENIALPLAYRGMSREDRHKAAKKYAVMLGLQDRLDHRPTELSGGQSQRVAIARALVTNPDIILADEPTGNLDSVTGREIMDVFFDLNKQGYTVVLVTHDSKYAGLGTRKITISDGGVIADVVGDLKPAKVAIREHSQSSANGMSFLDLLKVGFREGLFLHKMRTALTMLGIIIGVAGVIAMSSFSLGSKQKQVDQIRALGANMVRVVDNRLEGEKLSDSRLHGSHGLSISDMQLIKKTVPGVLMVAGAREIKLNIVTDAMFSSRIMGVTAGYPAVNNLNIDKGRFLEASDFDSNSRVIVIGNAIAKKLGRESPVGTFLLMGGVPYRIVGVMADRNIDMKGLEASGIADANYDVIMPIQTLLARTREVEMRSELDEINIQLESEDMLFESGIALRRLLSMTHNGVTDFGLVIPLDLLRQKQQSQRLLDILTICISSIALLVGGIGIMNIMLASVVERIREIGIRRTVGATRRDIKLQFLSESIIISIAGGLVGIVVAFVGVALTCVAIDLPMVVSPFMVFLAVAASTVTGLVFGIYPASQAAAMNPVEALRYE